LAFVVIVATYLLFAPNYQWVEETDRAAYGADFLQEWVGARMVVTGHAAQLYDVAVFRQWQYNPQVVGFAWHTDQYFPPVYPPPHYVLFSPFAMIPYRWATIVWLVMLIGFAFMSARCIGDIAQHWALQAQPLSSLRTKFKSQYVWLGLLLFPSLLFSITLGQKSPLWLLIACGTWRLLLGRRDWSAGMVFGLLSIKPTLFFLLPLVMVRYGRWRFLGGALTSMLVIWGGTACIVPMTTWMDFAKNLTLVGSYAENGGYRMEWSCNLMTLAYCLPGGWTMLGKLGICVPLLIYVLFCAIADKSHAWNSPEKALLVFTATLLASPHTYHYDLCLLLLPILWIAVTNTRHGVAYYAVLAIGVSVSHDILDWGQIPILPILLIAIVCELRLRKAIASTKDAEMVEPAGNQFSANAPDAVTVGPA
jgi:hypothetical protein